MDERSVFTSADEAATEAVGAHIASFARPGDVVGLCGELGAGKTVLVRGVLRALGGDSTAVHSPTFTLLNVYPARMPVHHFDLYRLNRGADLDAIGFYEFTRTEGIALIEWADRFPEVAAEVDLWVRIEYAPASQDRRIFVERPSASDATTRGGK